MQVRISMYFRCSDPVSLIHPTSHSTHLALVQRVAKHDGAPARLAVQHAHHARRQPARPAGVM